MQTEKLTAKQVNSKFTFIDLFAGIGGFHMAAKSLGGHCVFASEIDPYAKLAYQQNYALEPIGDITEITPSKIPDHDILFAGFPCQPFSILGNRKGFDDIRGTLFFDMVKILDAKKPALFMLENVKQLVTHNKGKTLSAILEALDGLGYKTHWKVLNALDYGLPQKRERIIFVGFKQPVTQFSFPEAINRKPLKQLLQVDDEVPEKYFASAMITEKRLAMHQSNYDLAIWHENKSGNISSYPYSCALRAGASYNYLLVNGKRRLTPREQLRLQGFPDTFKIVCNDSQTRKQAGNAVPVPMIREVLKSVFACNALN